jgi:hypothetical protein
VAADSSCEFSILDRGLRGENVLDMFPELVQLDHNGEGEEGMQETDLVRLPNLCSSFSHSQSQEIGEHLPILKVSDLCE